MMNASCQQRFAAIGVKVSKENEQQVKNI